MTATPNFTAYITYPGQLLKPSLLDVSVTSASVFKSPVNGGVYDAWCLIETVMLNVPDTYQAFVYSSYELANLHAAVPTLAGNLNLATLDNINWLLNYYDGANAAYGDVQGAIWKMMGSTWQVDYVDAQSPAKIDALVSLAMSHEGWVPSAGQRIAVVLDTVSDGEHYQPLVMVTEAASLGDRVWHDANANGLQDAGETGIAGATVQLVRDQNLDGDFSDANEVLASTTTDQYGAYLFNGLTPGLNYQVRFALPAGYDAVSPRQAGANAAVDSDALVSKVVVLAPGQQASAVDAGFYKTAALGGRVWNDANGDGQQQDDTGVAGARVTLVGGGADGLLSTTADNTRSVALTGSDGSYQFANLRPGGEYRVDIEAPAGATFTRQDNGNDVSDSDVDAAGVSHSVTLASGDSGTRIDAGIVSPASLGDRVWLDANGNGRQDSGEAGLAGVLVSLTGGGADGLLSTAADNTSMSTTTDADGRYQFSTLTAGTQYQIQVSAPAGSLFTAADVGADDGDSDVDASGRGQIVTLASGQNDNTSDAGVFVPGSLGDTVWRDANVNGRQDAGETGVAGVMVTLTGGGKDGLLATTGDNTTRSVTTDASGAYRFDQLAPGEYQVAFQAPAGTLFTIADSASAGDSADSDADADGRSQVITLQSGQHDSSVDAGIYAPATLGDRVWLDANANGRQDAGETGIEGISVTLTGGGADGLLSTAADNTSVSTVTGADGKYQFTGLLPSTEYQLQVALQTGAVFSTAHSGDEAADSDVGPDGRSSIITLSEGETLQSVDAGMYVPASLGDRVWVDANGNGQQDQGETGLGGVTVTLLGGGADGLLSTGADNTSIDTVTDAEGRYRFDKLLPGAEYQVRFAAPAGAVFTAQNKGADGSDSNADAAGLSQIVKLASGENNTSVDAGVYVPASLGSRVWLDENGNGRQDADEAGIEGVRVTLTSGGADGLLATTADNTSRSVLTDASGNYLFDKLTPSVEHQVQFSGQVGDVFTRRDAGADDADSDVSATGLSHVVKLVSGEVNNDLDAGMYSPASLGSRVWLDQNGNGKQDDGEAGVAGQTVTLLGGGADGLLSTAADNTSVSTTTAADGSYQFKGLTPGAEYQVQFGKSAASVFTGRDLAGGNDALDSDPSATGLSQIVKLASGEDNSSVDAGVYVPASIGDRVWLDDNGNGLQEVGEKGIAGAAVTLIGGGVDGLIATTADNTSVSTVTGADGSYLFDKLAPGMEYQVQFTKANDMLFTRKDASADNSAADLGDSDADSSGKSQIVKLVSGERNATIDAGMYATASIGDRLWVDTNGNGLQDDGATGLAGRTVTLVGGGADGLLATTADNTSVSMTTGANGAFNFSNLTPGVQYQVQFSKPTGYVYTESGAGSELNDSNANATTGYSQIVTLGSGAQNVSLDAGLINATGDLSISKTDGVSSVEPGQTVTYTIVVKNTGTAVANDALVTDTLPTYLSNVTWKSTATAGATGNQASGSGAINDSVSLLGGSSITYTVTAKVATLTALETIADFGSGANNAMLGQSLTVGGVRAEAAYIAGTQIGTANLVSKNATGEHGLGVWSKGEASVATGTVGQLSNQTNAEVIRLSKAEGAQWSSLWVSSLDASASGNTDIGTLYWSDNALPDLNTLSTKFTFKSGDFGLGATEGNLLSLRPAGFDADANYVFFVANKSSSGAASDFLVWKAGTVPTQIANTAAVSGPSYFIDTNKANNSATDTDILKLPAPAAIVRGSIGNLVWEDSNYNGVKDSGEAGLANVTVKLLDANNAVMATTTTNSSGAYLFSNLNAGAYKVEVSEPAGYLATKRDAGTSDAADSDIDAASGRSGVIQLDAGENELSVDAGLYRKASLGDKVWRDVDHDDIQDAGEEGIGGIKVMLYNSSNALVATTTTNSTGNYKFSDLDPGTYYLKFDKSNVVFKTYKMNDWMWGSKNIGSDDAIDSDVTGDGVAKTNLTRTDNITLTSGENDMSWDAAITPIAIDLNGDGIHTVARSASGGTFDLLGNGKAIASGWLDAGDGFLAIDRNGNGMVDDIGELFGGAAKGSGFARLKSFDSNGDAVVDAADSGFADLRIWRDANGNHSTDAGELLSLADLGVSSLAVDYVEVPFVDAQGNLHFERSSATFADGRQTDMTDVYFAISADDAGEHAVQSISELLGDQPGEVVDLVGVQDAALV